MKGFLGSLQSWMNCCTGRFCAGQESRALAVGASEASGTLSVRWLSSDRLFTQASNSQEGESDLLGGWEDRAICGINRLNHNNLLLLGCSWTKKAFFLCFNFNSTDVAFRALVSVRRTVRWWAFPTDVYDIFLWSSQLHGSHLISSCSFPFCYKHREKLLTLDQLPYAGKLNTAGENDNPWDGPLPLVIGYWRSS